MFRLRYLLQMLRWLLPRSRLLPPTGIGARVQVRVLAGTTPALEVIKDWNGAWMVSDGVADLDQYGVGTNATMMHVAIHDDTIPALMQKMTAGTVAYRPNPVTPWKVSSLARDE